MICHELFILYSIPLTQLKLLNDACMQHNNRDSNSPEYRLDSITMDIFHNRLFKPVQTFCNSNPPKAFLKLRFGNKGLDAIRLSNILNHKS